MLGVLPDIVGTPVNGYGSGSEIRERKGHMSLSIKLTVSIAFCFLICVFSIGCTSAQTSTAQSQSAQVSQFGSVQNNSVPSQPSNQKQDTLSYGMVTSKVKKNVTTQAQLLDLFGGPNIATTDSDGLETWVYERTATQSLVVQENRQSQNAAADSQVQRLGIFFGIGIAGNDKGRSQIDSQSNSSSNTNVTTSIKSLTVIIKFDKNKTVRDYSVRTASF
jgi:hypothetical protein